MNEIVVYGAFDDVRSRQMRFLEEASKRGPILLLLWSDEAIRAIGGQAPKFPAAERKYFLESVRYVERVILIQGFTDPNSLPGLPEFRPSAWAMVESELTPARQAWCIAHDLACIVIPETELAIFPPPPEMDRERRPGRKKVLVTGCYDWLHSGHVRFFEEAAAFGELYVVVGNDANVTHLKGEGHPLYNQDLRRYMVASIRSVHQALITSGWDWMDAEPEIRALQPDIYLVNEDGDRPEKSAFCAENGLEYVVLKRLPKEGLQARTSTDLRGF